MANAPQDPSAIRNTIPNAPHDPENATTQVKQLNDRFAEAGRKVGLLYVDSYEKGVEGIVSFQRKLADQGPSEPLNTLVKVQADVTQDFARAWAKVAREAITASA